MNSPFAQFDVFPIFYFINNFSIFLVLVFLLVVFLYSSINTKLIPDNFTSIFEMLYTFISQLITEQTPKGIKYFPLLFTLFNFILVSNVCGLLPFGFTITSHIALTLLLSLSFFLGFILQGFTTLGLKFLNVFVPKGVPVVLLPLLVVIEIISFMIRPLSLSIRLFANMLAGHILLFILGGATLSLGIFFFLPFFFLLAFIVLEIFIAFLQSYVFTILLSIYLVDSFHSH